MFKHINKPIFGSALVTVVPVSDLQKAPGRLLRELQGTQKHVLITQRGRVSAVLISPDHYEALCQRSGALPDNLEDRNLELARALERMLPNIIQKYKPEKIILFGSMATGRVTANSDIDLVIIKKTSKRPLDRVREVLSLVRPEVATDFFIYTPHEYEQFAKEGRVFFGDVSAGRVLYDSAA